MTAKFEPTMLYKPGATITLNNGPPVDYKLCSTEADFKDAKKDGWMSHDEVFEAWNSATEPVKASKKKPAEKPDAVTAPAVLVTATPVGGDTLFGDDEPKSDMP